MKKFDEFINENKSYYDSLKVALKGLLKEEHGISVNNVYVYPKADYDNPKSDHAVIVKLVKEMVQDIRKVPFLELGIEEAEKLKMLFLGLKDFGEKYGAYSHNLNDTAISSVIEIEFRFDEPEFLENSYLRSITGIDKYKL
jgi:hypothetical protein